MCGYQDPDGVMQKGIAIDLKTNQWVETQRLSEQALQSVFKDDNDENFIWFLMFVAFGIGIVCVLIGFFG